MTLTVTLPAELENRLETEAKLSGVSNDEFVRIALREKLTRQASKQCNPPFAAKIIATGLPVRDFADENAWLEKKRDEFGGQWVALDGDKLIASGRDGKQVADKVKKLGINSVFVAFVDESATEPFISGGIW